LLDGEATALSRKAVELDLAGDPTACGSVSTAPSRRAARLSSLCHRSTARPAIKAVADAVGRGGITPGEGFALRSRRAAKILVAERRYNQSGF
jgi:hypothetical protein